MKKICSLLLALGFLANQALAGPVVIWGSSVGRPEAQNLTNLFCFFDGSCLSSSSIAAINNTSGVNTGDEPEFDVVNVNSNVNPAVNHKTYNCDVTFGGFSITLFAPANKAWIKINDAKGLISLANSIVVNPHASEKIQYMGASYAVYGPGAAFTIFSDGTDWFVQ